ncbi:MAG: ribonuclease H-like YkuK family protein, partial [Candidatus Sungiibacteriota bacterium]
MMKEEKITEETIFSSESRGALALDEVMEETLAFVRREPARFYKIIIGTDSQVTDEASLVTALTIWRVG